MTLHVKAEPVMRRPDTPAWLTDLARFCAGLRFEDLPEPVVARTLQVIGDCIAAIAAGAQEPETIALVERMLGTDGDNGAAVIGAGRRGAPSLSAFLNGTAGTMLELDEGNQFCRGHPGIHVVPAVLAAALRSGASGRDVITAVALGYEIGARIGIASKLRVTMHPHGTWGTVGAAVAIAWLARRDAAGMIETINVASSLGLSTSRRTMLEGGTVRNSFAGFSNQIGLMVSDLVAAGFTGEADGLGTVYGSVIADDWRPDEMVAELGSRWEIARNYFKRHACCRYNHGALDALRRSSRRKAAGWSRTRSRASTSRPMSGRRSSPGRSRTTCWRRSSRCPSRSPPRSSMAPRPWPPSASRRGRTTRSASWPGASSSARMRRRPRNCRRSGRPR